MAIAGLVSLMALRGKVGFVGVARGDRSEMGAGRRAG